jgi:hypothetical protein
LKVVIVTGSRHWSEVQHIWRALTAEAPDLVVHGGCETGADEIAERWCRRVHVDSHVFRAKWTEQRRSAGPIRNRRMLEAYPGALVLAFPLNGPGTRDCVVQATERGHEVRLP